MRRFLLPLSCLSLVLSLGCGKSKTADPDVGIMFDATRPDGEVDAGAEDAAEDATPESDIGLACRGDDDCAGICISDWEGGYCSAFCDSDADCADGSTCTPVDETTQLCLANCDPAGDDCRTGYGCAADFRFPDVCVPGCNGDEDCPDGLACDPSGGFIGEGECFNPDADLGDACTGGEDCPASSFCFGEGFSGFPGGACIGFGCDVDANTGCPDNAECIPGRRGGRCYIGCTTSDDCRDGYACEDDEDFPGRLTCQPACDDDALCSGGRECNPAFGICDDPFDPDDLGRACSTVMGACAGGACLTEFQSGFPGSYCTFGGCDPDAEIADNGCPGDGVCLAGESIDLCLDGCEEDADCPRSPDYSCRDVDRDDPTKGKACFPSCETDAACANDGAGMSPDFSCNPGTGLCTFPFEDARLGEPCEDGDDCEGGACISEADDGYPAGTCAAIGCRLSGTGPEQACPAAGVCVDDGEGDPEIGLCLVSCMTGASGMCRPNYECVALGAGTDGACRPACEVDGCSGGRTCNVGSGLCE